ncbi:MAG: NifB/NifX family molybdenum-iron cluster-binding protein [Candidatus Hodarchaeota archaeon]
MKIAISATGKEVTSPVDPRFGRCSFFQIIETDTVEVLEVFSNTAINAVGGAGIQAAQNIANKGVKAVISGHFGPNAYQTLTTAGIQCIAGATGTVSEVVTQYIAGKLKPASGPTGPAHAGMGGGRGSGRGRDRSGDVGGRGRQ